MTDIDEVNDVIQETDEETYALDFEFTEEKEYKTVQKYELVTILSYLIGVRNEILDDMCSVLTMSTTMGKDIRVVSMDAEAIAVIKKNLLVESNGWNV